MGSEGKVTVLEEELDACHTLEQVVEIVSDLQLRQARPEALRWILAYYGARVRSLQ